MYNASKVAAPWQCLVLGQLRHFNKYVKDVQAQSPIGVSQSIEENAIPIRR
jgi:hypothetical protein